MPRVSPSAMPRKSEKVPSVTISGGKPRRATIAALSAPPRRPTANAAPTAAAMGQWASCQSDPSTTADNPIIDPTDRSMPPVMMTAVSARASKPSSTLRRVISKAFARLRKWLPERPNTPHSTRRTASSTSSLAGSHRWRHGASVPSGRDSAASDAGAGRDPGMVLEPSQDGIRGQRGEDDRALNGLLPERIHSQEDERGADGAQQRRTHERARQTPAPARDGGAADHHRCDRLELQADPEVARDRAEAHGVEQRGQAGQGAHGHEHAEHDARGLDAGQ